MRLALLILAASFSAACTREPETAVAVPSQNPDAQRVLAHNRAFLGTLPATRDGHRFGLWQSGSRSGSLRIMQRAQPYALRTEWHPDDRVTRSSMTVTDGRYAYEPRPLAVSMGLTRVAPSPLDVASAQSALEDGFFLAALYLDPLRNRGRVGFVGTGKLRARADLPDDTQAERRTETLRFDVPGGTIWLAHFATDDGALLEAEAIAGSTRWMRFADHREIDGTRVPFRMAFGGPAGTQPFVVHLSQCQFDANQPDMMFAGSIAEESAQPSTGGAIEFAPLSIPGSAQLIARDVRPDGGPLVAAVLDTGADSVLIHPELAGTLALPPCAPWRIGTIGGVTDVNRGFLQALTQGSHEERQLVVTVLQPPWIPQLPMDRQPGMIWGGEDFLAASPVLDLKGGRLLFRGRLPIPLAGEHVVRVPMVRRRIGKPLLEVEIAIGGKALRVLLDTGSAPTLRITKRGLQKLGLPDSAESWRAAGACLATTFAGASGENLVEYVVRLPDVDLGKLRFERPLAHLSFDERAGADGTVFDGLLGAGALLSFARVGLDAVRDQLEFVPLDDAATDGDGRVRIAPPSEWLGLLLASSFATKHAELDRHPVIIEVAGGSPAALRGVERGDVLLAIDGVECVDRSAAEVNRRLWLARGTSVELRVRGPDGRERMVVLP